MHLRMQWQSCGVQCGFKPLAACQASCTLSWLDHLHLMWMDNAFPLQLLCWCISKSVVFVYMSGVAGSWPSHRTLQVTGTIRSGVSSCCRLKTCLSSQSQ